VSTPINTSNPPTSAVAEPAPDPERAIRNAVDRAVDETFPASDPPALSDPSRRTAEPTLPPDAKPGDVVGTVSQGQRMPPAGWGDERAYDTKTAALTWVWPWLLMGAALQVLWVVWGPRRR